MADTFAGMPIERAFVVHGEPGWDEATPVGEFVLYDARRLMEILGAMNNRFAQHWSWLPIKEWAAG